MTRRKIHLNPEFQKWLDENRSVASEQIRRWQPKAIDPFARTRAAKGGRSRKGTQKRITEAITAMVADMEDPTALALLSEFEADSNDPDSSILAGLRQEGRARIKALHVDTETITYQETDTGAPGTLKFKSLQNIVSGAKSTT